MRSTSLDAFRGIQKELGARQQVVFDAIVTLGCPTNLEISKFTHIPINQITPRTNELVKLNKVKEFEKRTCIVSGRTAISWCVVR